MTILRNFSDNSLTKTAGAQIISGGGFFDALVMQTDGQNAVTVNIYDIAASATGGRELLPTDSIVAASAGLSAISFDPPLSFSKGLYIEAVVAGGGTYAYQAIYRKTGGY